jgi:hypothetical protein
MSKERLKTGYVKMTKEEFNNTYGKAEPYNPVLLSESEILEINESAKNLLNEMSKTGI